MYKLKISCDLSLCIYQKDNSCMLSGITIDDCGICVSCILVDVENLEELKKNQRERLDCE